MLPVMLPVMLVASKISKHKKRAAAKPDKPNNLDPMPIAVASSTQNKKSYQIRWTTLVRASVTRCTSSRHNSAKT
jgi:hypothetical protein